MLIRNLKKYWMNRMLCPLESKHRRHFKNQSLCGDKHCWQESNMRGFETLLDGQGKNCPWQPFEQAKKNLLYMLIRNLKKYRMNRMLCPLESKHRRHLKNQSLCGDKHCWQESNMRHFIAPWLRTCQIIFRPRGIKHGCPINSWSQRSTDDNVTPVHF